MFQERLVKWFFILVIVLAFILTFENWILNRNTQKSHLPSKLKKFALHSFDAQDTSGFLRHENNYNEDSDLLINFTTQYMLHNYTKDDYIQQRTEEKNKYSHNNFGGPDIYFPDVYKKDPIAFQKYLAYLQKHENLNSLQTRAVILLTNYRSGSSFFGELLNQHPDVFYIFEPLIVLSSVQQCNVNLNIKKKIIQQLAQCIIPDWRRIYQDLDPLTRPKMSRNIFVCVKRRFCFSPFTKELNDEEHCPHSLLSKHVHDSWSDCGSVNINIASNVCRGKNMSAIKVIRLCNILDLEELVTKHKVDLKIIHLVRDPRGIANSRLLLHRKLPLSSAMNHTCSRQANNANVGVLMKPKWLVGRYKMFRFEDAALNPFATAQSLYKFLDLSFDESVKEWIAKNTNKKTGSEFMSSTNDTRKKVMFLRERNDPWSHKRDSKAIVQKWKRYLSYSRVKTIERECEEMMQLAGYLPVKDVNEYKNLTKLHFIENFIH